MSSMSKSAFPDEGLAEYHANFQAIRSTLRTPSPRYWVDMLAFRLALFVALPVRLSPNSILDGYSFQSTAKMERCGSKLNRN